MRVEDVMTREVVTVRVDATLKDAARTLAEHRIGGAPVVDAQGAVVGVLSESDVLVQERGRRSDVGLLGRLLDPADALLGTKLEARGVWDAMTAPALTIEPRRPLREAALRMLEDGVNRLPVVDARGELAGIVTRADLVRAFTRTDAEVRAEILTDVLRRTLWIEADTIAVEVDDGVVRLSGTVDTEADADLLPLFVSRVPGVVAVESTVTTVAAARAAAGRR